MAKRRETAAQYKARIAPLLKQTSPNAGKPYDRTITDRIIGRGASFDAAKLKKIRQTSAAIPAPNVLTAAHRKSGRKSTAAAMKLKGMGGVQSRDSQGRWN